MPKEVVDITDQFYQKRGVKELLPLRETFFKHNQGECTCDYCMDVTRCALAYDGYNTDGDCLLSK